MDSLPPGVDLCKLPSADPPEGEISNLENPYSLAPIMIAVATIVTAWALLFVAVRVWVNRRNLKVTDYFIIIGTVWDVAFTGIILSQLRFARHQWNVPVCWLTGQYMKAQIIFLITALFSFIGLCKAAILLMYLQLFSISRGMRIAIWIGLVFDFLIYIPSIPMAAIYEAPRIGQSWDDMLILITQRQDSILVPYGVATGVASVLLDFYIFILPLPIIARLNLSRSKKIQISLVFMTALLGVAASVIALVYRIKLFDQRDASWQQASFYISMIVENNVVIIVSCMPAFAKAMKHNFSNFSFVKILQYYLRHGISAPKDGDPSSSSNSNQNQFLPPPVLHTFGSSQRRPQRYEGYYELDELAQGRSQFTVQSMGRLQPARTNSGPENGGAAILVTSGVFQHSEPSLTERLV
ncbi:hypothetical protein F4781DRAFT_141846 [Annulohypoxylon bovei var. microspora]|nr:hypothetical protein F4781DRAFT_141846 [Annulohypoxylon bovei var. microspora]